MHHVHTFKEVPPTDSVRSCISSKFCHWIDFRNIRKGGFASGSVLKHIYKTRSMEMLP